MGLLNALLTQMHKETYGGGVSLQEGPCSVHEKYVLVWVTPVDFYLHSLIFQVEKGLYLEMTFAPFGAAKTAPAYQRLNGLNLTDVWGFCIKST